MKRKATLILIVMLLALSAFVMSACEVTGNPDALGIGAMNTGERLLTGLLVFVMGLGMVFIVLFVLIAIIKAVAMIQTLPTKTAKKQIEEEKKEAERPVVIPTVQEQASDEEDEIVAAITAAITAYYSTQPAVEMSNLKFRVRSIKEIK